MTKPNTIGTQPMPPEDEPAPAVIVSGLIVTNVCSDQATRIMMEPFGDT